MKPYPNYIESSSWPGQIPKHWKAAKLRWLADINPSKSQADVPSRSEMVTFLPMEMVTEDGAFIPAIQKPISDLWNGFTYFEEGDVIVAKITPCFENGKGALLTGLGSQIGFGSTEFHVLRPRAGVCSRKFLFYLTRTEIFRRSGEASMIGAAGQKRVPVQFLQEFSVPFPPEIAEQRAIARFLDYKTRQIDTFIRKKQRLIELLKEERAAIINQAVTRGLDPDVPMKDSGIEWLGGVPAHWKIKSLKYLSSLQGGLTVGRWHRRDQALERRPYLRVANVQDGYLDLEDVKHIGVPSAEVGRYELQPGDVLLTEGGDNDKLGRGYVWSGQIRGCLHQNHIFAVRPTQSVLSSDYLSCLMSSQHGRHYFTSTAKQTTNLASTNSSKVQSFPVVLPPITEQHEIMDFLRREVAKIDRAISLIQTEIHLIQEYRSALISEAITGKISVGTGEQAVTYADTIKNEVSHQPVS